MQIFSFYDIDDPEEPDDYDVGLEDDYEDDLLDDDWDYHDAYDNIHYDYDPDPDYYEAWGGKHEWRSEDLSRAVSV